MTVSFTCSAMHLLLFLLLLFIFFILFMVWTAPPSPPLQLFVVLLFQSKFPYLNHTVCGFFKLFWITMLILRNILFILIRCSHSSLFLFYRFFKTVILCLLPNIVTLHSPPPVSLLFRCCLIICDLITIILKIYTCTLCSVVNWLMRNVFGQEAVCVVLSALFNKRKYTFIL